MAPELTRSLGNQSLQGLLRARLLQPKLTVSHPEDAYEQEADGVADAVLRMPGPTESRAGPGATTALPRIQRLCSGCEEGLQRKTPLEGEEPPIQGKREGAEPEEGASAIEPYVDGLHGRGERLAPATRAFFEPRFGVDFGSVRVHRDAEADRSARSIGALAYTTGSHIVFRAGHYDSSSHQGRHLLAHELTHVVQQGAAAPEHHVQPTSQAQRKQLPRQTAPAASVTKTLTIVSWINPDPLPAFDKFTLATAPGTIRVMEATGMALRCTANRRPPATLAPSAVASFLASKEFRSFQQYSLTYVPSEHFAPKHTAPVVQQVGYTAPSACPDIPPATYMPGETSPLNHVRYDFGRSEPNLEALMKFRVGAAEEARAIGEATSFPGSLLFSAAMLPRVPWVWTKPTLSIDPATSRLSWSVEASAFPTNTIYVDGVKVDEIPQGHYSVLLASHIRHADQPRQTMAEEARQRSTPIALQDETVRPGGSATGSH